MAKIEDILTLKEAGFSASDIAQLLPLVGNEVKPEVKEEKPVEIPKEEPKADESNKDEKEPEKKEETPENKVLTDLFSAALGDKVSAVRKHQPFPRLPSQGNHHRVDRCGILCAERQAEHNAGHNDGCQCRDKEQGFEERGSLDKRGMQQHREQQGNRCEHNHSPEGIPGACFQRLDKIPGEKLFVVLQPDPCARCGSVNPLEAHQDRRNRRIQVNQEKIDHKGRDKHIGHHFPAGQESRRSVRSSLGYLLHIISLRQRKLK